MLILANIICSFWLLTVRVFATAIAILNIVEGLLPKFQISNNNKEELTRRILIYIVRTGGTEAKYGWPTGQPTWRNS